MRRLDQRVQAATVGAISYVTLRARAGRGSVMSRFDTV